MLQGCEENSPPVSPSAANSAVSPNVFNFNSPVANTIAAAGKQPLKQPCTIYKINLNFLNKSSERQVEKFNELCENSKRTIKRDTSNYSSQFIFNDQDEIAKKYSIYQKIISSNVKLIFRNKYFYLFQGWLKFFSILRSKATEKPDSIIFDLNLNFCKLYLYILF